MDLPPDAHTERLCYLTTIGRVTGRAHEIEMWFAAEPGGRTLYVMAGGRERADWVRNLRAQPAAQVRIGATTYAGRAAIIEGRTDEQRARNLLADKYGERLPDGALSSWARESLPVAIELEMELEDACRANSASV
jgi:deazaflavin-dependent oxidoreductase (nitroreductase family)